MVLNKWIIRMAKHSTLNDEGHEWFWGVSIDELNLDLFFDGESFT